MSGLFAFLAARGDVAANPVPRGLPTRRERQRPRQGAPLVRTSRTLPRTLEPGQVNALVAALRIHRDRAMVKAMALGGLRRCEVLGLKLAVCRSLPGGSSSLTARAVTSQWFRYRAGSVARSRPIWQYRRAAEAIDAQMLPGKTRSSTLSIADGLR